MLNPSARVMGTVPTLSDRMICPPAVVKSQAFGNIFPIKRLRSLVRYRNAQESKYHINLVFNIIFDFVVIIALSKRNGLGSESSSLVLTAAAFTLCYCWLQGLSLGESLQSCLTLPIL